MGKITGLDAANPCFEGHPGSFLSKGDAKFVDAIHTNGCPYIPFLGYIASPLSFGFVEPFADLDFFVNGGCLQPKCLGYVLNVLAYVDCNHVASIVYYSASISLKDTCPLYGCKNEGGKCDATNSDTLFGYFDNSTAIGNRYVNTEVPCYANVTIPLL